VPKPNERGRGAAGAVAQGPGLQKRQTFLEI